MCVYIYKIMCAAVLLITDQLSLFIFNSQSSLK